MSMIVIQDQPTNTGIVQFESDEGKWLSYFDRAAAVRAVESHVAALPSKDSEFQHTAKNYKAGLKYWLRWAGDRMPSADLVKQYIAHLRNKKWARGEGLVAKSINSKYLAVLKHYLKALAGQYIKATGEVREFVEDCRFHIRAASEVKGPKEETTSHVPALWRADKIRLEQHQVRHLLGSLDRESLDGLRDYTLLLVAFNTGYRVAELRRITLNSISQAGSVYLLSVVGKRNNIDPVPVGAIVVTAIQKWVDTYNEAVGAGDPRQIVGDVPLWQPLRRGGHPLAVGDFNPCAGVSTQAIGDVIGKRSAAALGEKLRMAAHDTRRTFASVLYDAGMPTETIGENLRHSNLATTKLYIGKKPLYESRVATNFVQFG